MERVNIMIGPLSFDHADYDAENDVLYLHIGEPEQSRMRRRPRGTSGFPLLSGRQSAARFAGNSGR
jgi:hypothetical protein